MMIAALSGYEEIVVKLLDAGADVNAVAHVSHAFYSLLTLIFVYFHFFSVITISFADYLT